MARTNWLCSVAAVAALAGVACTNQPEPAVEQLEQARQLSTSLLVRFTKASHASDRAVMADTDQAAVEFAREADQAIAQMQADTTTLAASLHQLQYTDEQRLLSGFGGKLAEYGALDRKVLDLAVENTNVKAQRLAFGPAQQAVDALTTALDPVARSEHGNDTSRVRELVATTIAAVREMQVLEAPHIAEAEDGAMARMEAQMATAEAEARNTLEALFAIVEPASRSQVTAAKNALARFVSIHERILQLSRRNSDVQSLALSLGQKRTLAAGCENSLLALQGALAKRGFSGTR